MTDILFIALEFPPQAQSGVYRSLKFVKYLPEFRINSMVLTLDLFNSTLKNKTKFNFDLLNEIPSSINIYKLTLKDITRKYSTRLRTFITVYFRIYDVFYSAVKVNLFKTIDEIFLKHNPKLIYVSLPPFSSALIAIKIKKRYKLPLVVDMRDGWSKWCIGPFATWIHYRLTHYAEYHLFKSSDKVINVSDELRDIFLKSHPMIDKSKFNVIPNGYDSDIKELENNQVDLIKNDKFIICYLGRFYYTPDQREMLFTPWWKKRLHRKLQYAPVKEDWLYRSPYFFFKALVKLFKDYPNLRNKVYFGYAGAQEDWLFEMLNIFGLGSNFINFGYIKYSELSETLKNCNAFLSTSVKVISGEDYALASKTFDYIKYNKPIIGFVTEGIQKKFLINSGLGIICDPDDEEGSSNKIKSLLDNKFIIKPNINYLSKFKRKLLTDQLAKLIEQAVNK